ncbi:MAG TPA: hypothetical protein VID93_08355, partial [Acidimicrobiales bacterium]
WGFLELIHQIQVGVFTDLPSGLGFDEVPWWWPLPILVLAGIPVAYALRLPGAGGHVPAHGLTVATTTPNMVPASPSPPSPPSGSDWCSGPRRRSSPWAVASPC